MKALRKDARGFGLVAIMVILLVVGVAGFAGYKVYNQQQQTVDITSTTGAAKETVPEPTVADVPAKVENSGDLADLEKVLNQTDTNVDTSTLDADLDTF